MITALALLLSVVMPNDALDKAWRARAERATKKLLQPGLDACDRAVELAFQKPKGAVTSVRTYALEITVGKDTMLVGYHYDGQTLKDFSMFGVPPTWRVHQLTDSKTISVVLKNEPGCAFDLCSNDPFSDGPCASKK
jgi:hypothetical protein